MSRRIFPRSLRGRVGVMMGGISFLALAGMGASVVIAEMLKGESAAINQSGSLRMQSYRVLASVLAGPGNAPNVYRQRVGGAEKGFEARLRSERLVGVLPETGSGARLRAVYEGVVAYWRGQQRPAIDAYLSARLAMPGEAEARRDALNASLMAGTDRFVGLIDYMVRLLEEDAERKVHWLRAIESSCLMLTLMVVAGMLYLMKRGVLGPLKDLLACAERARLGDFSRRAQHTGGDELGGLGHGFNVMAEDLSKLYDNQESLVAAKTAELTRSNRSLELLYHTLARLSQYPVPFESYVAVLGEVQKVLGFCAGCICMEGYGTGHAAFQASTLSGGAVCPSACSLQACAFLRGSVWPGVTRVDDRQLLAVPLEDQERTHGVMLLEMPREAAVEPWQVQLAQAVGRHIGIAIGTGQRIGQGRRMALLEERNVIARELHDSLAQALSYLKIQVARLHALLQTGDGYRRAESVVEELREGLNAAYGELRELLATFRSRVDTRGLRQALEQAVDEFRARGDARIVLDYRLGDCPMSVNEETHVLRIVREALANLVQHASAKRATVALVCDVSGAVEVSVEDNGVGIQAVRPRLHHYGLAIMRERAESLGGELRVGSSAARGTRVLLRFTPGEHPEKLGSRQD
jgi:two-component system nitrate/nitrite sensor histidine kinase NarX